MGFYTLNKFPSKTMSSVPRGRAVPGLLLDYRCYLGVYCVCGYLCEGGGGYVFEGERLHVCMRVVAVFLGVEHFTSKAVSYVLVVHPSFAGMPLFGCENAWSTWLCSIHVFEALTKEPNS